MIRRLSANTVVETAARRALAAEPIALVANAVVDAPPAEEGVDAIAFRKGYADGFEAGEQDAARDHELRVQALEDKAEQVLQARQEAWGAQQQQLDGLLHGLTRAMQAHEQAMRELSFELAAATLQQVFTANEDDRALIARLCERLAQERRGQATQLEVSTVDRVLLPESIDGLPVVESSALDPGQCRLVGEYGASESSIAVRLAAIFDSMLEALGRRER
jgi:flagellar biosynthesis/type III secretory pathway protein FliH